MQQPLPKIFSPKIDFRVFILQFLQNVRCWAYIGRTDIHTEITTLYIYLYLLTLSNVILNRMLPFYNLHSLL